MNSTPDKQESPYRSDAEYVGEEFEYIRLLLARIEAERRLREARQAAVEAGDTPRGNHASSVRELRGLAVEWREQEQRVRQQIDARLAAHRADMSRPRLGLDAIGEEAGLGPEERVLLLAACVPSVSTVVADHVVGAVSTTYCGSHSCGELARLLDPRTVTDWIALRHHFRPGASPLIEHGLLIVEETRAEPMADSLMTRDVRVPLTVFARIMGDPGIVAEGRTAPDEASRS